MKKLLGIVLLGLFFNSNSYAETWSCSYLFDGEEKLKVMKRIGNNFYSVYEHGLANQSDKIVKENSRYIHLYWSADNLSVSTTGYLTILDKEKKGFVMVGLDYDNSTKIVQGKCIIN